MILIFVIIFCSVSAIPSLIKASKYHKENIRIFDDVYNVGIWDLKFDEELYGYQGFGSSQCFSDTSCFSGENQCDPCDWTDPDVCSGLKRGNGSLCSCSNPPLVCYKNLYPYAHGNWPRNSNSTIIEIYNGGIVDVAYYPRPPNNCSRIIFKFDVDDGVIQGVLLYNADIWTGNDATYILSRHGTVTICPSDPQWGHTYVIRIFGMGPNTPYAKVRVSVEYQNFPKTVYISGCHVANELKSTHQCVATNIYTKLSPLSNSNIIRVVIDPPANERCGVMGFWASSNEHLISTHPWVSTINSTNALRTHREGPYDNRPWPSIYSYCLNKEEKLYAYILSSVSVEIMVDTSKSWMIFRSLSDFGRSDYYKRFFGAVTANCPNNNYTAHRNTYTISESMDTGSANLRMIYPSDDLDIFYPPPLFASDAYHSVYNISVKPYTRSRIIVSLFLSQRLSSRSQPLVWTKPWFQNAYQWLSIDEWNDCTLSINNMITGIDKNGANTLIKSNIVTDLPKCDPYLYSMASKNMDKILDQISGLSTSSLPEIQKLWFIRDRIASSNDFYACKKEIESYYTKSVSPSKTIKTKQCVAIFNTTEFNNDVCCKIDENDLYDSCVSKERIIYDQYHISDYTELIKNCSVTDCAKSSVIDLLLQLNLDKDPTACVNTVNIVNDKDVYWKCINKIWGSEPVSFAGPQCRHDYDCPGSICDIYSKRCFIRIAEAEIEFISCVYDNLTQFTRTFVSNELGLNPLDPRIKNMWLKKFSNILLCSDPYTPVGFDLYLASYGRCYGCDRYLPNTKTYQSNWALSPGRSWPNFGYDCWSPGSSSCSITISPFSAKTYCQSQGCNNAPYEHYGFFPFLLGPSFCINNTFCGVSDNGFFYKDVTNIISIANCNNAVLCLLANGTQIRTNTEDECKSIFSCDNLMCNGEICYDENTCSNSGYCSDSTDYNIGIWSRIFSKETAGCFFTVRYRKPFNPTVSVCEPPFRNTILGCSVYPGGSTPEIPTFVINESSCISGNFSWGDPSIQELINPRWITIAKTQTDCLNYGRVCDLDYSTPAGVDTYTNTYNFADHCANSRNLFNWVSGKWLPGQPRFPNVVVGNISTRFNNIPRLGLNLPLILSNLTKAINKLSILKAQSSTFCHYAYKKPLDELMCMCVMGYNDSFCYQNKINITSIVVACNTNTTINVADLRLILTERSLPPATCENLFISASTIVPYQSRTIIPLRTLLVNYQEDTEYAIRNKQLAIYGKVLTSGYSATFTTKIHNLTICIKLSSLRQTYISQLDKYPIFDIAKRPVGSLLDDLVPLGATARLDNVTNFLCAGLDILETNNIYYFIQRINQDYNTVHRSVFTSGEIAYISVLLSLYCFGLISVCIRSFYLLYVYLENRNIGYSPIRLSCVLFLIGCFFLFRVVLFSFLLSQELLDSSSTRAINYLLFEFPILLYFAFVTNYICIWITLLSVLRKYTVYHKDKFTLANFISIFVNAVIFILFIIMIILFQTIIPAPYFICGGSILLYDTNKSFILLLAYRVIFSSIAIILGIMLFLTTIKLSEYLNDPENHFSRIARIRLMALSVVGGIGLIAQAIYFLIITVTQSTPVNYASLTVLLVVEIVPALLFIFIEPIANPKKTSSKSKSPQMSSITRKTT